MRFVYFTLKKQYWNSFLENFLNIVVSPEDVIDFIKSSIGVNSWTRFLFEIENELDKIESFDLVIENLKKDEYLLVLIYDKEHDMYEIRIPNEKFVNLNQQLKKKTDIFKKLVEINNEIKNW